MSTESIIKPSSYVTTLSSDWDFSYATNKLYRTGNIAGMNMNIERSMGIPDYNYKLFTLPEQYRPTEYTAISGYLYHGDHPESKIAVAVYINEQGEVYLTYGTSTSGKNTLIIMGCWSIN